MEHRGRHHDEASREWARLDSLDQRLDALPRGALSLAPDRDRATRLTVLVERATDADDSLFPALATCVAEVVEAELENFPDNLFWDFDFLVASLVREACASRERDATLARRSQLVTGLMRTYGRASVIRFAFVHDFAYGFDWAKWVRRKPHERASVGPFALEFLGYSQRRGHELAELVERDDPTYPRLRDERPRNVFFFSRAPADEIMLLRDLAQSGLVPVEAWRADASPRWERDFAELRERRAIELGIAVRMR